MKNIIELHNLLKNNKITADKLLTDSLELAHKYNDEYNFFVTIIDEQKACKKIDTPLSGIPCAIKDNISTKGILSTASSNTLKDYVPIYDATVVKKLKDAGATIIGKTTMDELGMGCSGTTAHTGIVRNPHDKNRMTGGSSAGSAGAVAAGICNFALGSDTGDSIRKPAAYCGVVGYKPTYGLVSRFGLFAFASSLDHVGVLANTVEDAALVIDTIKGKDEHDMTSLDSSNIHLYDSINYELNNKKLCYIKEICNIEEYENPTEELRQVLNNFKDTLEVARSIGIEVEEVSFNKDLLKAIYPSYLCISCAEATSNYSNLTGFIFGPRSEGTTSTQSMKNYRTLNFSPLIKRRFVIGSYVLQSQNQEKYFKNAQRIRRLIVDNVNELFKEYDGLILPCSGHIAPYIDEDTQVGGNDILENHMAIGNFGGFPSISIPCGSINKMPLGVNITSKVLDDENLINIAASLQKKLESIKED